jgi:DNA-binding MarR family transcriptional regulator
MNAEMYDVYAYKGWVKVYRGLFDDDPLWTSFTAKQKVVLVTLLLMANHTQKSWEWQGKPYICKPGQMITSQLSIAKKANLNRTTVRRALQRLSKLGLIEQQPDHKNILITVNNWELYQANDSTPDRSATAARPQGEHNANTDRSQGEHTPFTNKNVKNEKNEKNGKKYPPVSFSENYSNNRRQHPGDDSRRFKTFAELEMEQIKERRRKAVEAFLRDDKEE